MQIFSDQFNPFNCRINVCLKANRVRLPLDFAINYSLLEIPSASNCDDIYKKF